MADAVYLDYSQDDLDRAYDQRVWAPNVESLLADYASLGAVVRQTVTHHADVRFGSGDDETLDWFPAEGEGRAIHVHLHGGAWRALSKHDVSFVAPAFTGRDVHFVAPNFTNLPKARLPHIVDQLVRAVSFIYENASRFGGDPGRIFISGHSSGAHLCAVLLTQDWATRGLPRDALKGGLCISGSYDLTPVMLSARRLYIDLRPDEVFRLSPIRHVGDIACPIDIVYGGRESPEFMRQGQAFADALSRSKRPFSAETFPDLNHFEIALQLAQPGSVIHRKAMTQIESLSPSPASHIT